MFVIINGYCFMIVIILLLFVFYSNRYYHRPKISNENGSLFHVEWFKSEYLKTDLFLQGPSRVFNFLLYCIHTIISGRTPINIVFRVSYWIESSVTLYNPEGVATLIKLTFKPSFKPLKVVVPMPQK